MFLLRAITLPPRAAYGTTKLGYKTVRFLGLRRLFWIGVGVGIGLLVSPGTGAENRRRLAEWWELQQRSWNEDDVIALRFGDHAKVTLSGDEADAGADDTAPTNGATPAASAAPVLPAVAPATDPGDPSAPES